MRLYTYNTNAWHPGLGYGESYGVNYDFGKQFGSGATSGTQAGISTANQTGSVAAGAVAGGLALASSLDPEPFSKAALAIGAALTGIVTKMIQGCGQTCIDASNYVNEAEPYFVQNVQNYMSGPRTRSLQTQALANFDNAFGALQQRCQQIGGQGGINCIKDRTSGSCKWKAAPWSFAKDGTYTPAGTNGSGTQCWNWVYGYRDPIANDPFVQADAPGASGSVSDVVNSISNTISSLFGASAPGSSGISPLVFILGGVALYLVMDNG